jgi:hypothetical protein
MSGGAFLDKTSPPGPRQVQSVLGPTAAKWNELREEIARSHSAASEEWKFYTKESGWTLVVKSKQRTLLYMRPQHGSFLASLALGQKAVDAALASRLPQTIKKRIQEARAYVEGRGVRIEVKRSADLAHVRLLLEIKTAS